MRTTKIRFRDLNWITKIGIIGGVGFFIYCVILFGYGFILGLVGL